MIRRFLDWLNEPVGKLQASLHRHRESYEASDYIMVGPGLNVAKIIRCDCGYEIKREITPAGYQQLQFMQLRGDNSAEIAFLWQNGKTDWPPYVDVMGSW